MSRAPAGRPEALSLREARALALAAGAGFPTCFPAGPEGVARAVEALGFVQIDTISVVRRAHEHILWSRVPDPGFSAVPALEGVGGGERRLVEYWAHAAAYLPVEEWRFCLPRMERIRAEGHEWFHADPRAVARVRDRVAAEGPLSAKDFQEAMSGPRGWWDWKPAKVALEYLFHSGELACATRRGFQKVYDLAERQIPAAHAGPAPTEAELSARHVERAARSLGIFTKAQAVYQRKDGLAGMDDALAAAVEAGILVPAAVEGLSPGWYARRDLLESLPPGSGGGSDGGQGGPADSAGSLARVRPRAFVLSPFDPFLIDRKRTVRLWDFAYTLECYVSATKRAFGYFTLPVLFVPEDPGETRFAGLADAKADRRNRALILRRLRLARGGSVAPAGSADAAPNPVKPSDLARAVAAELARFAAFQGAEVLELEALETDDPRLEKSFRQELARASAALVRPSGQA